LTPIFELGASVRISVSGETGVVIGLATYLDQSPQALVRYCAADGRAVESWWNFSALETA
jgi:hypothetical protein